MRKSIMIVAVVLMTALTVPAFAELQNVQVGGSIKIRGNWWSDEAGPDSLTGTNKLFAGPWWGSHRPIANPLRGLRWLAQPGRFRVMSGVDWDEDGSSVAFVEQRTRLNVKADFTDMVSAYIELDSYDVWGEDFRSNYITGMDGRAATGNDVELYQAYIEANEMFGYPVRARIGRQEIVLGSGWLIGTNNAGAYARGLSFDGIRLTYATDMLSVDAIAAKLAENGPVEEDADVDLYSIYVSYLGLEDITLDAYWIYIRDARSIQGTVRLAWGTWWEDVFDVDDYDPTNLHTLGLRGAGTVGAFDFEAELAFQFGNMDAANSTFAGAGLLSPYGPDGEDMSEWAGNLQVGYTFDTTYTPRVFLGGAYFGGEDERDVNFWDWLGAVACPFWSAESSLSFNRLFSDWQYTNWIDAANHDLSNAWLIYGGVSAMPTEDLTLTLSL